MYAVHDSEGRFVGHPRSAVAAHRWSRRANMAGPSEVVARYLTKSGKVGLEVKRFSPTNYSYIGEWGAGSGFSLAEARRRVQFALDHRKGWRLEYASPEWSGDANRAGGESMDVATTILAQMGGGGRLRAMIGAKDFSGGGNVLTFRWAARARNGANNIRITLEPSDTYKVEFFSVRGRSVKSKGVFEDIYAEDLIPLFERETGLYLRM